jgi:hypothetical protein
MRRQGQYLAYMALLLGTCCMSYGEQQVVKTTPAQKVDTVSNDNNLIDQTKEKAKKFSKKIKDAFTSQRLSSAKNNKKEAQDEYDHFFKDFEIRYAKADYKNQDSLRKELGAHRKKLQKTINELITVIQKETHDYQQDYSDLDDQLKKETKTDDKNKILDKQKRIKTQLSEFNDDILNCYKDLINYSQKEYDVIKKLYNKDNKTPTPPDDDQEEES